MTGTRRTPGRARGGAQTGARLHPRTFCHVALIVVGFLVASAGVAYAYLSAAGSGTYALARAGALDVPSISVASHTQTSATLTWTPPSNPTGTTWVMTGTGASASGTCFAATPTSPCTVTGLTASTTYHYTLTYTLHTWHATSNTLTITTTAAPTCGKSGTIILSAGKTAPFTLIGGGGGNGSKTSRTNASGGNGAAGAEVTGSLANDTAGSVTLTFVDGCKGSTAAHKTGGAGSLNGYALGGAGGTAHATPKSGGAGGGGGASSIRLTVAKKTTVIAVAGGGGGGGGAAFTTANKGIAGTSASPNLTTKPDATKATGLAGTSPSSGHTAGGGGGGGGVTTPAAGGGVGAGGTGGYSYTRQGTVTGVGVTVSAPATGDNPHATGSFSLTDPPSASTSPSVSLSGPAVTAISPATGSASGGTAVTITGAGFTQAATVSFGATPAASVTVQSATTIVATSPAHAPGQVDVVVTDATGTSSTSAADLFTYRTGSPPSVTATSPTSGAVGGGTQVVITGTGFTPTATVDFGTTAASSVTVTSPTALTVVAPPHPPGTVDVTVTTGSGTSDLSTAGQFTFTTPAGAPTTSSGTSGGTG